VVKPETPVCRENGPLTVGAVWLNLGRLGAVLYPFCTLTCSVASDLRSLEQLFGVPWPDVALEHVEAFLDEAGEEPEPLLWEAKGGGDQPNAGSVRKAACGFANSEWGGYLIVGADGGKGKPWKLNGVTFRDPEPKTWLERRAHELSPPPQRDAKAWTLDNGRRVAVLRVNPAAGICITPDGTVYQRVSGGTLPVTDQYVLSQLFQRGERAREAADRRASTMLGHPIDEGAVWLFTIAVASTGFSSNVVADLHSGARNAECLRQAVAVHPLEAGETEHFEAPSWMLRQVSVDPIIAPNPRQGPFGKTLLDRLYVQSEGAVAIGRHLLSRRLDEPVEPRGPEPALATDSSK